MAVLKIKMASLPRIDAYMLWALYQGRIRLGVSDESPDVDVRSELQHILAVTIELKTAAPKILPDRSVEDAARVKGSRELARALFDVTPSHNQTDQLRMRFRTGWVTFAGLERLLEASLSPGSNIERFEVALALGGENFNDAFAAVLAPDFPRILPTRAAPSAEALPVGTGVTQRQGQPLVCVIDDRCNFASTSLRDDVFSGSRVEQIWLQGADVATLRLLTSVWSLPFTKDKSGVVDRGAWSGKRLNPNDVNKFRLLDEPLPYRQANYMRDTPHSSHGAAVVDLLAGNRLWIDDKPHHSRTPPPKVHFVQLPVPTVTDTQGGSLAPYIIDGILDALQVASDHQDVIVNISFGTHSGAHDGSSLFDMALLELLQLYDGSAAVRGKRLHVVLPAGNSHLWRCHASGYIGEDDDHVLDWKVQPDDDTDNFVEIWVPRGRKVRLSVVLPGQEKAYSVTLGQTDQKGLSTQLLSTSDGQVVGAIFGVAAPSQSECSSLFLVVAGAGIVWTTRQFKEIDEEIHSRYKTAPSTSSATSAASSADASSSSSTLRNIPRRPFPADAWPLRSEIKLPERAFWPDSSAPPDRVIESHGLRWLRTMPPEPASPARVPVNPVSRPPPNALRPSSPTDAKDLSVIRPFALHGVWQMKLAVLDGPDRLLWNAWVQRGDTAPMRQRSARGMLGRQSYFVDNGRTPVDPGFTLNGIGTAVHPRLYVVGAMHRNDGSLSDYSGSGPAREHPHRPCGPDVVVPADESRRRLGLLVQGVHSGSRERISGTSMAAPVFARLLYEYLCEHPGCEGLSAVSPDTDTVPPVVPAGAPQHACPFNRGDPNRVRPLGEDGRLWPKR